MSDSLTIDAFAETTEGEYLGQFIATFNPEARCEPCEEGWETERALGTTPRLANRPIPGAYAFTTPDGREEVWCLGHLQDAPEFGICP